MIVNFCNILYFWFNTVFVVRVWKKVEVRERSDYESDDSSDEDIRPMVPIVVYA